MTKKRGSVTVFVAILLSVVLSCMLLLVDGVRIVYANTKIRQTIVAANEHVLANYHKQLQEQYHLFFLDPAFLAEKGISEEMQSYFAHNICNADMKNALYSFQVQTVSVVKELYPDEKDLTPVKHQIREYMKYRQTTDWTNELLGKMNTLKEKDQEEKETKQLLERRQEEMEQAQQSEQNTSQTEQGQGEAGQIGGDDGNAGEISDDGDEAGKSGDDSDNAEGDNIGSMGENDDPRNVVMETINGGILKAVVPQKIAVSSRKITSKSLPSNEIKNMQEQQGNNKIVDFSGLDMIKNMFSECKINDAIGNVSTEALAVSYIMDCFSNFSTKSDTSKKTEQEGQKEATKLKYEVEYIICGKTTDKENLENIVNRILLFRFGSNFSYALTDATLNAQALSIATVLAGVTGLPPVITAIQTMILAAVSYAEAILDVRSLLSGNKIPILKNSANWMISMQNIGQLLSNEYMTENDPNGMSYEDFLKIFLLAQTNTNAKYGKMLDLIQENIKIKDKSFSILEAMFGYEVYCEIKMQTLFGNGTKVFQINRSCSY